MHSAPFMRTADLELHDAARALMEEIQTVATYEDQVLDIADEIDPEFQAYLEEYLVENAQVRKPSIGTETTEDESDLRSSRDSQEEIRNAEITHEVEQRNEGAIGVISAFANDMVNGVLSAFGYGSETFARVQPADIEDEIQEDDHMPSGEVRRDNDASEAIEYDDLEKGSYIEEVMTNDEDDAFSQVSEYDMPAYAEDHYAVEAESNEEDADLYRISDSENSDVIISRSSLDNLFESSSRQTKFLKTEGGSSNNYRDDSDDFNISNLSDEEYADDEDGNERAGLRADMPDNWPLSNLSEEAEDTALEVIPAQNNANTRTQSPLDPVYERESGSEEGGSDSDESSVYRNPAARRPAVIDEELGDAEFVARRYGNKEVVMKFLDEESPAEGMPGSLPGDLDYDLYDFS